MDRHDDAKASGVSGTAPVGPLSDDQLRLELQEVDGELATLRRRVEQLCRRGAALADEQRRRFAFGDGRDSVDLQSDNFRALDRKE